MEPGEYCCQGQLTEKVISLLGQVNSRGNLESECAGSWPGSACDQLCRISGGGLEGQEAPAGVGVGSHRGDSSTASDLHDLGCAHASEHCCPVCKTGNDCSCLTGCCEAWR